LNVKVPATRWVATTPTAEGELTSAQVESWRSAGYAFVSGLLPESLITGLAAAARTRFPPPNSDEARGFTSFGGPLNFPSDLPGLNDLTLHPAVLQSVSTLLSESVSALRLTQSDLWAKYGREDRPGKHLDNADQRIHVDYPNHTLAHPTEWTRPEAVEMIIYLNDVETTGGATAIVPREGSNDPAYRWPIVDTPGVADLEYVNDRDAAEQYFAGKRPHLEAWRKALYDRERQVRFQAGDVLLYRHDTWHRGTPMHNGTLRLVQNISFRRASSEWISTVRKGWAWSAYRKDKLIEKLIARASLDQRAVLGFPQPGSPYWSAATIDAVEARHGVFGIDMTPYRAALAGCSDQPNRQA
jgi:ectoine hydroxylase-related dioxygenase (phytanoyl-CoA dioxygenase family)